MRVIIIKELSYLNYQFFNSHKNISYFEANKNDNSNILKRLILKSSMSETQPDINKDQIRKKLNIPFRLLGELKKFSEIIFFDPEFLVQNVKPKYPILYDNSSFIKYKNLFAYDMEIIYSYTPKIKKLNSSSDGKKIEHKGSIKTKNDQLSQHNESDKNNKKEIKVTNENYIDKDKNKSTTNCFNLFNPAFFGNQLFRDNTNQNNLCFLNTKRIQKITTPVSTKIINSSPFKEKTTFLLKKNNSAFRNLKSEFEEK